MLSILEGPTEVRMQNSCEAAPPSASQCQAEAADCNSEEGLVAEFKPAGNRDQDRRSTEC